MTRYAIGDLQGCDEELEELLGRLHFSADRDQLWFVGDLVNRGPESLAALRRVHALRDNSVVVLGNHDLHLLALAYGTRRPRDADTLTEILHAPDRDRLLEWLIGRPLAHHDAGSGDLMVHAGLVPQWSVATAVSLAAEVSAALQRDPATLFAGMYGDRPDRWSESLSGIERLRFTINVLTRLRVCTAQGRVDLAMKGRPHAAGRQYMPWFEVPGRASRDTRIVFGHWSALGFIERDGVVGLDSGCVWGGALTGFDLDTPRPPVTVRCAGYRVPGPDV